MVTSEGGEAWKARRSEAKLGVGRGSGCSAWDTSGVGAAGAHGRWRRATARRAENMVCRSGGETKTEAVGPALHAIAGPKVARASRRSLSCGLARVASRS